MLRELHQPIKKNKLPITKQLSNAQRSQSQAKKQLFLPRTKQVLSPLPFGDFNAVQEMILFKIFIPQPYFVFLFDSCSLCLSVSNAPYTCLPDHMCLSGYLSVYMCICSRVWLTICLSYLQLVSPNHFVFSSLRSVIHLFQDLCIVNSCIVCVYNLYDLFMYSFYFCMDDLYRMLLR